VRKKASKKPDGAVKKAAAVANYADEESSADESDEVGKDDLINFALHKQTRPAAVQKPSKANKGGSSSSNNNASYSAASESSDAGSKKSVVVESEAKKRKRNKKKADKQEKADHQVAIAASLNDNEYEPSSSKGKGLVDDGWSTVKSKVRKAKGGGYNSEVEERSGAE
jgi:hypothetical protein